jgi:hypothetical protein
MIPPAFLLLETYWRLTANHEVWRTAHAHVRLSAIFEQRHLPTLESYNDYRYLNRGLSAIPQEPLQTFSALSIIRRSCQRKLKGLCGVALYETNHTRSAATSAGLGLGEEVMMKATCSGLSRR